MPQGHSLSDGRTSTSLPVAIWRSLTTAEFGLSGIVHYKPESNEVLVKSSAKSTEIQIYAVDIAGKAKPRALTETGIWSNKYIKMEIS